MYRLQIHYLARGMPICIGMTGWVGQEKRRKTKEVWLRTKFLYSINSKTVESAHLHIHSLHVTYYTVPRLPNENRG